VKRPGVPKARLATDSSVGGLQQPCLKVALLFLASMLATFQACGGSKFTSGGAATAGNAGLMARGGGDAAAGEGPDAAASGAGGADMTSGAGAAGEASEGTAGEGGATGFDCSALDGAEFAQHCYLDVTVASVSQVDAVAVCEALAQRVGRSGELLMLDSREEQAFVIAQFLTETTDAWLGLTCSSKLHADLMDCYCTNCDDGLLVQKRAAWTWLDGSSSSFGWSGKNPNDAGRCSALAFNNSTAAWGWVDRGCLSTTHQLEGFPMHSYRVLCELR
jgi:hypothetical protein